MVGVPLAVAVGDTLPHCETPQETVHVTPLAEASLLTFAVTGVEPVAITEFELVETETVIGLTVIIGELLPPPQPEMIITERNPRNVTTKDATDTTRFIDTSAKADMQIPKTRWTFYFLKKS